MELIGIHSEESLRVIERLLDEKRALKDDLMQERLGHAELIQMQVNLINDLEAQLVRAEHHIEELEEALEDDPNRNS